MQISPINNVNFNGKFLKTPELKELLTVTDKETLTNFNKIINRMAKVDDGQLYKIVRHKTRNPLIYSELFRFYMNKEDTLNKSISCEHIAETHASTCETPQEQLEKCSDILRQFLPKLENKYPKSLDDDSKTELIEQILNKLA